MKHVIGTLCILMACSLAATAQCDKDVRLTSSKTQHLDSSMTLQRTEDEKTVIDLTKTTITIAPGNSEHVLAGTVTSATCNWTVPYKEGSMVVKAKLSDGNDEKEVTITITGINGQVTLLFEMADMPDRKIRVAIDSFEEKK